MASACVIRNGGGKYCSRACFYESLKTRLEFACATCGKASISFPSKLAKGFGKYCSRECCAAAKRKDDAVKLNPAYESWHSMKKRCSSPNPNYSGRGIGVCDRWVNSFEVFLKDMGPRPPGMTLDRIDVNGHYEPSNCRWASPVTQSRNRRNTIMVRHRGRKIPLAEYAEIRGVRYAALNRRIRAGDGPREAADILIKKGCGV